MTSGLDQLANALMPDGGARYSIFAPAAPSDGQRQALAVRRDVLDLALRPAGQGFLRSKVATVVAMIPAPGTDGSDPDATTATYCAVLADLPSWAAEEACLLALRGKVGTTDGRFRPSPGEIHVTAERLVAAVRRERDTINRVLCAAIVEPVATTREERAAIVAKVLRPFRQSAVGAPR